MERDLLAPDHFIQTDNHTHSTSLLNLYASFTWVISWKMVTLLHLNSTGGPRMPTESSPSVSLNCCKAFWESQKEILRVTRSVSDQSSVNSFSFFLYTWTFCCITSQELPRFLWCSSEGAHMLYMSRVWLLYCLKFELKGKRTFYL